MSRLNEIKTKIKNIKSTEKITRAMEMISASKMRKAQDVMRSSRPFSAAISELINNLSLGCLEKHYFFVKRPEINIGLLIIASDRGLCGGLNINLFRKCYSSITAWQNNNVNAQIKLATIGEKSKKFFNNKFGEQVNVIASREKIGKKPKMQDLIGITQVLLQEYKEQRIDSLYIAYNEFETTMQQKPTIKQLLPIVNGLFSNNQVLQTEYIFEPDRDSLLDLLLKRYVESLVYQGVVENIACEQSARMIAMKSATDNAKQIIEGLQLNFNKERQAIITKEISEIVGGSVGI
ncbi:MAG: ATP synthase F1 subunit gamma [Gammaproteobacteria bacterium]|jgi:F-type H+-transporting ATPase subunit gamma